MIDTTEVQTENAIIAYFDVIGYKSMIERLEDQNKLLLDMMDMMDIIRKGTSETNFDDCKVHVKTFSDNIVMVAKYGENDKMNDYQIIKAFGYVLSLFQLRLLCRYGLMIRGCITKGKIYIDDNIIFGDGLVRAVQVEGEVATFPRIIIDSERINIDKIDYLTEKCLCEDEDGKLRVDLFAVIETSIGNDDEFMMENASSQLMRGSTFLRENITKWCNYNGCEGKDIFERERTISKYIWALVNFNQYCYIYSYDDAIIEYKMMINPRVMRCEIVLKSDSRYKENSNVLGEFYHC